MVGASWIIILWRQTWTHVDGSCWRRWMVPAAFHCASQASQGHTTHMHAVITRSLIVSIIPFYFNFRLGCPGFTNPSHNPTPSGGASNSLFFPDEAIWSGHPRYKYYQLVSYSTYLCLMLFVQNSDKKHPTEEGWKSSYKYSKLVETFLW